MTKINFQLPIIYFQTQSGYIAIVSMLIISAAALAIAVSISLLGVDESRNSLSYKKGVETLEIAKGCADNALIRLRDDDLYTGGSISLGEGACLVVVTGSDGIRAIDVTAQITGPPLYEKKLSIDVERVGNSVNVVSWNEVQ